MGKKSKQKQQKRAQQANQQKQGEKKGIPGITIAPAGSFSQNGPSLTIAVPNKEAGAPSSPSLSQTSAQKAPLTAIPEVYLRRDITRIMLTLGVLALMLIGLVIVNNKTTVLKTAGHKLSVFAKLQN